MNIRDYHELTYIKSKDPISLWGHCKAILLDPEIQLIGLLLIAGFAFGLAFVQ